MKVAHFALKGNFIGNSIKVFEAFFPKQNIFFFIPNKANIILYPSPEGTISSIPLLKDNYIEIKKYFLKNNITKIVLHGLYREYIDVLSRLVEDNGNIYDVYWIFYGYELYYSLSQRNLYDLNDANKNPLTLLAYHHNKYSSFVFKLLGKEVHYKILEEALPFIKYFCFWNKQDFELLNKFYKTNLLYKFFSYGGAWRDHKIELLPLVKKQTKIIINQQASPTGNHITVFEQLKKIDEHNVYEKVVPLSYGSEVVKKVVSFYGEKFFREKFSPITRYMQQQQYFTLLSTASCAIYGAKRQEAAGNIYNCLRNGIKVFLRNDNNLLTYYKGKGFIIYSFDDELKTLDDLCGLSREQQEYNRKCSIDNQLYYEDFMPTFFD